MEFMKMICAKGNIIKSTKEEVGKKLIFQEMHLFLMCFSTTQQSQLNCFNCDCCVKRDGKQKKKKTVLDHSSTQPEKRKENERKNRNLKKEILESE